MRVGSPPSRLDALHLPHGHQSRQRREQILQLKASDVASAVVIGDGWEFREFGQAERLVVERVAVRRVGCRLRPDPPMQSPLQPARFGLAGAIGADEWGIQTWQSGGMGLELTN